MARKKFLTYVALACILSILFLSSCGGGDPDEGQVADAYDSIGDNACYHENQFSVDQRFGLADPGPPKIKCSASGAVGDVFVFAFRYNESDRNRQASKDKFFEKIGWPNCDKLAQNPGFGPTGWGPPWKEFDHNTKAVENSEERVDILICGWVGGKDDENSDLARTISYTSFGLGELSEAYQSRVARVDVSSRMGFSDSWEQIKGPACDAFNNGYYYEDPSGKFDGGLQGFCVQYYSGRGSVESCNENRTNCTNIPYQVGPPPRLNCNENLICDTPWENPAVCGDCKIDCEQRATSLPAGKLTYSQLIATQADAVVSCQGDLNSPGYLSASHICKICPKPFNQGPKLPGREWLQDSWAWPWSTPAGSYSNSDDSVAWGCVNVQEGSPLNCGVCGIADIPEEDPIEETLKYLGGGFCAATFGANNVFCADPYMRTEFKCQPPDAFRADPASSPWFAKYYANPSYFYTTTQVGSGWKSSVSAITCAQPGGGS